MILELILTLLLVVVSYGTFNLLKKVEKLEDIITDHQKYMQSLSDIISESHNLINTVDERGVFESDDDIGFFFKYLKMIQETLDTYNISDKNAEKKDKRKLF